MPVITRLFEPDIYGVYTLLTSATTLVALIIFSWLNQALLRYYDDSVRQKEEVSFLSTIFYSWLALVAALMVIVGILYLLFLNFFTLPIDISYPGLFLYLLVLMVTHSFYLLVNYLLRAARYSRVFALLAILTPIGRLLLAVLLVLYYDAGVEALLIGLFSSELVFGLLGLAMIRLRVDISTFSFPLLRRNAAYGIPMVGALILNWLLNLSDRYIIGYYHGPEAVGVYSIAYNLGTNSVQLVFMALMFAALAQIIHTWNEKGRESTEQFLSQLASYYLMLTVPIVAGVAVLGKPILTYLTTEAYVQGYMVIGWVAGGLFFFGFAQYVNKAWELTGKTQYLLYLTFIAVVVNIFLNLLLVPSFGFVAAGITTVVSYCFYLLISWATARKYLTLRIDYRVLVKVVCSSAVMIALIVLVNNRLQMNPWLLVAEIVGGALFYGALLLLLGVGRKEMAYCLKVMKGKIIRP